MRCNGGKGVYRYESLGFRVVAVPAVGAAIEAAINRACARVSAMENTHPALSGCCRSSYLSHHTDVDWYRTVSPDVMEAWHRHRSYYALVEILDTHVQFWTYDPPTKAEVRDILGPRDEGPDAHPGIGPNTWVYWSRRKAPFGNYCFITFGEDDNVKSIDWASE